MSCCHGKGISAGILALSVLLCVAPVGVSAQEGKPSSLFVPTPELRGQTAFWRHIFTKYGKNQLVFHHRDHPTAVYSILDLSEYADIHSDRQLARIKSRVVHQETVRIQHAIDRAAEGQPPRGELEERITRLMREIYGDKRHRYRDARDPKQIRYQTGIRERFMEGVKRSGRYVYAIKQIFRAEGLPEELAYLPLVESSFDYKAYSTVGAAGIWQFMRSTGARYLRISAAVDERRDPIMSSRAAARYLAHAYKVLGAWPLAVTSYNHGIAGIARAVKNTGSRDLGVIIRRYESKSFGFASKNFYTEFLAALEVAQHSEKYFPGLDREEPWFFEEVLLGRSIGFHDLERHSGVDGSELMRLNPALREPVTRGGALIPAGYFVKVPAGSGGRLAARLGGGRVLNLDDATYAYLMRFDKKQTVVASSGGKTYRVQRGDTLGSIARRFGVPAEDLMHLNRLSDPRRLRLGQVLNIPDGVASTEEAEISERNVRTARLESVREGERTERAGVALTEHRVKPGETVGSIARRYGVSQEQLMRQNSLRDPRRLRAGAALMVPAKGDGAEATVKQAGKTAVEATVVSTPEAVSEVSRKEHVVKAGDTIGAIAKHYGVSSNELMRQNSILDPRRLVPGMKLTISGSSPEPSPATPEVPVTKPEVQVEQEGTAEASYRIEAGDTIGVIARRFSVSQKELMARNGIKNPARLRVGQVLKIPAASEYFPEEKKEEPGYYVIQRGDTLGAIARKQGISLGEIRRLNPGISSIIRAGKRIRIR